MSVFVEAGGLVSRTGRKTKKKYSTKYNAKYREDFPWAMPSGKGETFAFCICCEVDICIRSVGAKGLRDHALTCRHSQKWKVNLLSRTGSNTMQEENIIQSFNHGQPLSNAGTHGYENLCTTTGQISTNAHIATVDQLSTVGHMATGLSVESLKIHEQINTIDNYGFNLQEHDSRYTTVSMGGDISNTVINVGNASNTHSIASQSPHSSSVNNTLYSVVGDECTTLQPLYSYPPQMHTTHGMPNRGEQSCDKIQRQVIERHDLALKTRHEVLDHTHEIFQTSHSSSFESGSSSSIMDKSGGLSVADLTCNVCGTVFDSWMDLKNDLLQHIKHAQEQPRRKKRKHAKLLKKEVYAESNKDTSFSGRKGRPPGIKKKIIDASQPDLKSNSIHNLSSQKHNHPLEETISPEDYYSLQNTTVVMSTVQEIPQVTQQPTAVEITSTSKPTKKSNPISCRVCQAMFTSRQLLKDHIKVAHNNGRPFECDVCKKFFTKKSNLEVHKKHKHSGEENSCECQTCGKVLSTRTNLRIHLRIHEGKKPFACTVCTKRFNRKANLEMHTVYHTGERRFTCEMCGKSFFAINALKRHRKLHTGERDHGCKVCGSTYVTATDLRRHMLKHNDVKPYPCTLCEKQFTRSHDLKVHLRYHNKDHQFTCPECKKKFVESGNYRRHLRRHTGERPYACSQCFQTFTQVHHYKVHVQNQHKDGEECARNRVSNADPPDKSKNNVVSLNSISQNVNSINNGNSITVLSQMVPNTSHATIPAGPHQHTIPNVIHTMHNSAQQPASHPVPQCQPQINSTQSGVIQQYNYVYNSSVVPHYHTIFDVCPHPQQQ